MPKHKPTKHEDDILRGIRPPDGIHTCSKGCKKPGCNRGLRDTIEEQDALIVALKQDLLEQSAATRHLRCERIHDLNQIGGLQEENARLKAEVERLTQEYSDATNHYNKLHNDLEAEVERLRKAGDAMTEVIWLSGCVSGMEIKERTVKAWQAAKEGKQS